MLCASSYRYLETLPYTMNLSYNTRISTYVCFHEKLISGLPFLYHLHKVLNNASMATHNCDYIKTPRNRTPVVPYKVITLNQYAMETGWILINDNKRRRSASGAIVLIQ